MVPESFPMALPIIFTHISVPRVPKLKADQECISTNEGKLETNAMFSSH